MLNWLFGLHCPDCGGTISESDGICPHCGADLETPISEEPTKKKQTAPTVPETIRPQAELSPKAIEHFNRAIGLWNDTEESKRNDTLRRDVCSELALAIKKASAPFPRAHALLAMYLNDLGVTKVG